MINEKCKRKVPEGLITDKKSIEHLSILNKRITNPKTEIMKTKFTRILFAFLFLLPGVWLEATAQDKEDENPNFTYIDDFELGVGDWFAAPSESGSTNGVLPGDSVSLDSLTVVGEIGSTKSMRLDFQWDNEVAYEGLGTHFARQVLNPGLSNVPERHFQPGQALEFYMYGDGSGNRFRVMARDGGPTLEGSDWMVIDWVGWKRILWDYNKEENVFGWVNGNGVMEGDDFYFDGFHFTKPEDGTGDIVEVYFDALRIVDPFNVDFNITDADGSEIISIAGENYTAGETSFQFFPGEYEFFVKKDGFITSNGTFIVDDSDITVDVTLDSGADTEYEVNFTVMDVEGNLINDAVMTVEGTEYAEGEYTFNFTPGFYNYMVVRDGYFEVSDVVTVLDQNLFVNVVLEEIPDLFNNLHLMWDVAVTANTPEFRAETYSIWVGPSEEDFNPDNFEMVYEETFDIEIENLEYQPRMIEISEFQEQTVKIAFRHHNSTDNDRIIIDNIRVEASTPEMDTLWLQEDFEGGLPEGFDPNTFDPGDPEAYDDTWLPENWMTIDNDGDGNNWYYVIDIDQDLNYFTEMRSKSWDSDLGALTPDNWLVTPEMTLPLVSFYTVEFIVTDESDAPVADAVVTINGTTYDAGVYEFTLTNGDYDYMVEYPDYDTATGTFTVAGDDATVEVQITPTPFYDVTFNVDMNQADGFEPGVTEVYMAGDFPGWDWQAPGSFPEQQMSNTDNVFIYTNTLSLPAGTYNYKYFDQASFDGGEWAGEPNREVIVTGDMTVDDVFGQQPTNVDDFTAESLNVFPNPANNELNITSEIQINEVMIFDITGQRVYSNTIENDNLRIDLSDFNNGMYLLHVITSQGIQTQKIQVVK